MRLSPVSTLPIGAASPVTTFNTPAGTPAFSAKRAKASAQNGVNSDGLMMIVQPAASAGPALRVIIASGKFHGVTAATTPTGALRTIRRRPTAGGVSTSPVTRKASSANQSRKLAA